VHPLTLFFHSTILSVYPTDRPLLSVGTFEPKAGGTGSGYHTVFDSDGSGMAYSAVASSAPYNQSGDRILTLANPQKVDMSGITLTVRAIPVTMNNVGYILDGVCITLLQGPSPCIRRMTDHILSIH